MSIHWHHRSSWARQHKRRRGHARLASASEVRLAVLGGIFLGLAFAWGPPLPVGTSVDARAEAGTPLGLRVIDGDTFDHGGVRIRVADIDTPEVRGQCASERALAQRATVRMRALLEEGPFELHRAPEGRDQDRYGRKLRIVTRDGRSLGDQLVAEGLAWTWSGRREPWCV